MAEEKRVQETGETFDFRHLDAQTGDDPALKRDILILFSDQATAILPHICDVDVAPKDRADLCHKLKGSAQAIGAFDLADVAATVETELRAGGEPAALSAALPAALHKVLVAIRDHF